jgi:hypothetical protein
MDANLSRFNHVVNTNKTEDVEDICMAEYFWESMSADNIEDFGIVFHGHSKQFPNIKFLSNYQ